jgi:hypothetical protein
MKVQRVFLLAIALMAAAITFRPAILFAEPLRPNIIFILTDDLDTEYPDNSWIDHFPRLKSLLADQGTTFINSFVSLSLCCPSRTAMLRGQYAHNTQIFTNSAPGGGFQKAHDEGLDNATFATWLHDAGYRTALIGKYLNGYPGNLGARYIAQAGTNGSAERKTNTINSTTRPTTTVRSRPSATLRRIMSRTCSEAKLSILSSGWRRTRSRSLCG